jgi:hypothetical protein
MVSGNGFGEIAAFVVVSRPSSFFVLSLLSMSSSLRSVFEIMLVRTFFSNEFGDYVKIFFFLDYKSSKKLFEYLFFLHNL